MVNWKKRGFKLLGAFFTGYSGGFSAILPGNMVLNPQEILWFWIFVLPALSGLVVTWPQLAKIFNELGSSGESSV